MSNNSLNGKFFGWVNGIRLYKERRGLYHCQKPNKPDQCFYSGTLREIEKALKGKIVRGI